MDRALISDLHAQLAPEGGGGLLRSDAPIDASLLAATANEFGARFAELHGPTSKAAVLERLGRALGGDGPTIRDWDALEALLARPPADHAGPVVIAWHDPARLDARSRRAFAVLIAAAAESRARAGDGSLLVVAGPEATSDEPAAEVVPESIGRLGRIHHVALIVASLETALGFWRDMLRLPLESIMDIEADRVRIAFLGVGESKVELVEPTDETTGVARFLASRGEGFHHVCFEVENLAETLLRLEIDGLELIDSAPRRGAEGPVAFIHPRSCHGVLVELIEAPGGPSWVSLGFPGPPQQESHR
jgi:methylmalonyl-CoA epimerase